MALALLVVGISNIGGLDVQPEHWQRINALAIDPHDPRILYLDVLTVARGGLFKSTDGGLVIDPRRSATLYAGNGSGLFKTNDAGSSWRSVGKGLILDDDAEEGDEEETTANVHALAIDPQSPNVLFAGTDQGLFKSVDGGESWSRRIEGSVRLLALAAGKPAIVYAFNGEALLRSKNAGESWSKIGTGEVTHWPSILEIRPRPMSESCPDCSRAPTEARPGCRPARVSLPPSEREQERGRAQR